MSYLRISNVEIEMVQVDHKGNRFNDLVDMCKYWHIKFSKLKSRLDSGWSLEDALEIKPDLTSDIIKREITQDEGQIVDTKVFDHRGTAFESILDMCKRYGIDPSTFVHRLNKGWGLKDALEVKYNLKGRCKDHLGIEYSDVYAMCEHYHIQVVTLRSRLSYGYTLSTALTAPINTIQEKCRKCTDHLGNTYDRFGDMCEHWGIEPQTFSERIKRGWDLKKALTTPVATPRDYVGKKCTDHLGNTFNSVKDMCKYWGVNEDTYCVRIRRGWSLKDALEKPVRGNDEDRVAKTKVCKDHKGNIFNSVGEMCAYYGLPYGTYYSRRKDGWSLRDALEIPIYGRRMK